MNTKHTVGPWSVGGSTGFLNQVAIEPAIGCAYGSGVELAANARLIAAAPDLLDALVVLVEEKADYMRRNSLGDPEREQSTKMSRAAIAKAAGVVWPNVEAERLP